MRHNHAAIAAGVVSAFLFGFVWYSLPFVIRPWAEAWNIDLVGMEPPGLMIFAISLLGVVVQAYVLSWLIQRLDVMTAVGGLWIAALLWVGIQLPATVSHYLFGGPGTGAIVVDSLNSLATLAIIGAIVGRWRVDRVAG
jgi:hypothetical protein